MSSTPNAAAVKMRLRALAARFNVSNVAETGPPGGWNSPGPELATERQISALISLLRSRGKKEYLAIKNALGIEAKIPELTKSEAWHLINKLMGDQK